MKFKNLRPLIAAAAALAATSANAAVWSSTARYGAYSIGAYSWNNDAWSNKAGPQTIWVNSISNWGVTSTQHNTSGVKTYPHEAIYYGVPINSMNTLTSSWSQTAPAAGSWDFAYDIWDSNNSHEIMIWTNWAGGAQPIAATYNANGAVPTYTNVCVGGACWNVYEGSNGSNATISLLLTSKANSGTVDLKAILRWIESTGYFGNLTIGSVQYGVEISSTNNQPENFNFENYSITWN